jgi:hypothetical protein
MTLWGDTPPDLPALGPRVSRYRQWRNARSLRALVDEIADRSLAYPDTAADRRAWREALRVRILDVVGPRLGWPASYARLAFGEDFHDTAVAFARDARATDPRLSLADLGQALRNVWIANTLQILNGRPVRLTPALFAYSMLYPATDNVLDDVETTSAAKRGFNARLGAWLTGGHDEPSNLPEAGVRALVGIIAREFPLDRHPAVWASVRGIHDAQVASLRQHGGQQLAAGDLLALTVAKGGASVMADYFLVTGGGDDDAARFAFAYGVFLQMLDDLQDVDADLAAGHETLFTRAARKGPLDALAQQLARYIDAVLDGHPNHAAASNADCVDVIRRNCRALIVGVMARHPNRFSRGLRRRVERQWPMTLRSTRRLMAHGQRRLTAAREQVQQRRGVSSPLGLLLDEMSPGRRATAIPSAEHTTRVHNRTAASTPA